MDQDEDPQQKRQRVDVPQEEEEDTAEPAPEVKRNGKKGVASSAPATRGGKGGGRGNGRSSKPSGGRRANGAGKKQKDGGNGGNDESAGGGEDNAGETGVARVTRQTRQVKCTSNLQPPTLETSGTYSQTNSETQRHLPPWLYRSIDPEPATAAISFYLIDLEFRCDLVPSTEWL